MHIYDINIINMINMIFWISIRLEYFYADNLYYYYTKVSIYLSHFEADLFNITKVRSLFGIADLTRP